MMPRKSTSVRLSPSAEHKLQWLAQRFENQSTAIEVAIDRLYQTERRAGPGDRRYDPTVSYTATELWEMFAEDRDPVEWFRDELSDDAIRAVLDAQGVPYDDDLVRSIEDELLGVAGNRTLDLIRQRVRVTPELHPYQDVIEAFVDGTGDSEELTWLALAPVAEILEWAEEERAKAE